MFQPPNTSLLLCCVFLREAMAPNGVTDLENALRPKWSCLGRDFVKVYAASLAQTLHAQVLFVIDDIDHIDWEHSPYESSGSGLIDVQVLGTIKLCDDDVAIELIANVQVVQSLPKPDKVQKWPMGVPHSISTNVCHCNVHPM